MTELTVSEYQMQKAVRKEVEQMQDEILEILTDKNYTNKLAYEDCINKKLVLIGCQAKLDAINKKIEIADNNRHNSYANMFSGCHMPTSNPFAPEAEKAESKETEDLVYCKQFFDEDDYEEYKEAERTDARLEFVGKATKGIRDRLKDYQHKAEEKTKKMVAYININEYDEEEFLVAKTAAKEVTLYNKLIAELQSSLDEAIGTAEEEWASKAEAEWEKQFDEENGHTEEPDYSGQTDPEWKAFMCHCQPETKADSEEAEQSSTTITAGNYTARISQQEWQKFLDQFVSNTGESDEEDDMWHIKDIYIDKEAGTTVVIFTDNTKYISKCQEGDVYDFGVGFALCLAKKATGDYGKFLRNLKKSEVFHDCTGQKKEKKKIRNLSK